MTDALEAASAKLLARLDTEGRRPPTTPGTHLVGGITKVGSRVEAFLRVVVVEAARSAGLDEEELRGELGGSVTRAGGGTMIFALRRMRPSGNRWSRRLKLVMADVQSRNSTLQRFVRVRNEAAHEGTVPKGVDRVLSSLRKLIIEHRQDNGWGVLR